MTMSCFWIDSRDHAIRRNASHDPKHAVGALFDVLADHGREQRRRLRHVGGQHLAVDGQEGRVGVSGEPSCRPMRSSACPSRRTDRRATAAVGFQRAFGFAKNNDDCASDERDGVLRRDRVVEVPIVMILRCSGHA